MYFGFCTPEGYGGSLLTRLSDDGRVRIVRKSPLEPVSDILCQELFEALDANPPRRLFIDGLDTLVAGLIDQSRVASFVAAINAELASRGVTTVASATSGDLFGAVPDAPAGTWGLVDSIVLLRSHERDGGLNRSLAVTKSVQGAAGGAVHAYRIDDSGFSIGAPSEQRGTSNRAAARARRTGSRPAAPKPRGGA